MNRPFAIALKTGETVYVNGAVLKVDRKVVVEVLNDVDFLLGAHVLRPDETTTALRQLYFIAQTMLMDPANRGAIALLFEEAWARTLASFRTVAVTRGLHEVADDVRRGRIYDALKALRALFPLEDAILGGPPASAIPLIDQGPRP